MNNDRHISFIEKQKIKNPNLVFYGAYKGNRVPIDTMCKICKHRWPAIPQNLKRNKIGCPSCGGRLPLQKNEFVKILKIDNPDIKLVGSYKDKTTATDFICKNCGYKIHMEPYRMINHNDRKAYGCHNCKSIEAGKKRRMSEKDFLSKVKTDNPDIEVLGRFITTKDRVEVKCKKCKRTWNPQAGSLYGKNPAGCKDCKNKQSGIKRSKSKESFEKQLKAAHPNYKIVGNFINMGTNVDLLCETCNKTWPADPYSVLHGHGCPNCAYNQTSKAEKFIYNSMCFMFGEENVVHRDKQAIGMELDILIKNKNLAIEYGSWYWHKKRITNDIKKQEACSKTNINLIMIYDSINTYIEQYDKFHNLYLFENDLWDEKNLCKIKKLVIEIGKTYCSHKIPNNNDFKTIIKRSTENNYLSKTKQLIEKLKTANPRITVLGEFIGDKNDILVMCSQGHIFSSTPNRLKKGAGCKKCADKESGVKKRINAESWLKEALIKKNPNIIILGEYVKANDPIMTKCIKCSNREPKYPSAIMAGVGCSKCARKIVGSKQKKSVICIETNKVYDSAKEAAEDLNVSKISVGKSCRNEIKCVANKFHFKYI